jgi:hypothetical protein
MKGLYAEPDERGFQRSKRTAHPLREFVSGRNRMKRGATKKPLDAKKERAGYVKNKTDSKPRMAGRRRHKKL